MAGKCHGHATGDYPGKEFEAIFWHGEPIQIIRFEGSTYVDVITLRGAWTRHGPEFTEYRPTYYYNRMWTNGGQSGAKYYKPDENNTEDAFFDNRGQPRWEALHNWCDVVPNPASAHSRWGETCTYDPAVDVLTKTKNG